MVTLTMVPNLLPHEARPVVLWGQAGVMDDFLLLVTYDGASMNSKGLSGLC